MLDDDAWRSNGPTTRNQTQTQTPVQLKERDVTNLYGDGIECGAAHKTGLQHKLYGPTPRQNARSFEFWIGSRSRDLT